MKRRDFLKTISALAAIGSVIDDLGYGDLGSFGCRDIPTPHMDSLAANGVRCTNSYVTNPPCSPSRCCVMTGMYIQRFGKSGMARGLPIPEDHPTMAEFMRDAGYVTGMIGKWDIGSREQGPLDRGFMEVARSAPSRKPFICLRPDGSEVFRTDLDGDYMAEFVERNKDKPFFLYFSPNAILLTGDNGPNLAEQGSAEPYRGGKGQGTQLEGWVHTPTIISWPAGIPSGKIYDGLMCTMDFYATVAAVADKPLPKRCCPSDVRARTCCHI